MDGDGGPLPYFTGKLNRATMLFNNFVCQRNPSPVPLGFVVQKGVNT